MMFDPSHFDVIITFKKSRYKAEIPSFSGCFAYGKTEKEALKNLSQRISHQIKKVFE